MESYYSKFSLLNNLGVYSPKDYLNQGLKIIERNSWHRNSLLLELLRGSVVGHFRYHVTLVCLNWVSIDNHQSSHDYNDILLACTSRIKSLFSKRIQDSIFYCKIWSFSIQKLWLKILNMCHLFIDLLWYPITQETNIFQLVKVAHKTQICFFILPFYHLTILFDFELCWPYHVCRRSK